MTGQGQGRDRSLRRFVAAAAILAVTVVAGTVVLAAVLFPPARAVTLTFERDRSAPAAGPEQPAVIEDRAPAGDALLTSERFRPAVTFRIRAIAPGGLNGGGAELCFKVSDAYEIVLQHVYGCLDEVRLIHPSAVDCGGFIARPDATTVAAAILARPDLGALDLGPLDPGRNIRPDLLTIPTTGRVIDIVGDGGAMPDDADPDRCRFLPPPGSDAPPVEIRRDTTERYVLIDHRGELFVLRAGTAGHDAASVEAGYERGYGSPGVEGTEHMIGSIYDVRLP